MGLWRTVNRYSYAVINWLSWQWRNPTFCFEFDAGGSWNHPPSWFLPATERLSASLSAKEKDSKRNPKDVQSISIWHVVFTPKWTVKFLQRWLIGHTGNYQKKKNMILRFFISEQTNEMSRFKVCHYFVEQACKNCCCTQLIELPGRTPNSTKNVPFSFLVSIKQNSQWMLLSCQRGKHVKILDVLKKWKTLFCCL